MISKLTLEDVANDSGMNLFELVRTMVAKKISPSAVLDAEQEREIHQLVSENYGLGPNEKAKLLELMNSDRGKQMLSRMAPYFGAIDQRKFVRALAEAILNNFGNEIEGIGNDVDQIAIERTIFNLGPRRFMSIISGHERDDSPPSPELLRADPNLFYGIAQKELRHVIENSTSKDYDSLLSELMQHSQEIRDSLRGRLNGQSKKEREGLETILRSTFESLDGESEAIVRFKEEIDKRSADGFQSKWHQALRMYHLTRKDDEDYSMKRAIIADCTAAGKTFSMIGAYGLLREDYKRSGKKKGIKGLIISPKQAIHSVWGKITDKPDGTREWDINKYMKALGLPNLNLLRIDSLDDLDKIDDNVDLVMINYEKLALSRSDQDGSGEGALDDGTRTDFEQSGKYLEGLISRIDEFSTVVVDEGHNLKNTRSKRSGSMIELVERTKDKHFWVATATTIPNRTKDAGFILYMLDPKKFSEYKDKVFDIREDRFSIPNMVNSANWFRLNLPDLQKVFELGPLPHSIPEKNGRCLESRLYTSLVKRGINVPEDQLPTIYDMPQDVAEAYYKEWENMDTKDVSKLPQILLRGSIPHLTGLTKKIFEDDSKSRVTLFARHKECFVDDMIESLVASGIDKAQIGVINGDESAEAREKTAEAYKKGDIKVVLCSSQVSESFSLTSGVDKNYFIFAEPPFVPGVYEQAVGRGYRAGQKGEVITVHPIPESKWLEKRMLLYKEGQEKHNPEMKVRRNFTPTNFFEDAFTSRLEKRQRNEMAMKLTGDLSLLDSADTEDEDELYIFPGLGIHKVKVEESPENQMKVFTKGFQSARAYQGRPVEELNAENRDLPQAYHVRDLMNSEEGNYAFPPKRTAGAIEKVILAVEEALKQKKDDKGIRRILDVGSGTAVLARQLDRPIVSLDSWDEMIEGGEKFLHKERGKFGVKLYEPKQNIEESRREVSGLLDKLDRDNLLVKSNARNMPFEDGSIDFLSCSYAIMYNQQDFERRDIEEIFLEFNRILRDGGYGLLTLPGETTREAHKEIYESILKNYGFKIVFSNYITDSVLAKKGRGAYSILFEKEEHKLDLHKWEDEPEIMYFREHLIGGRATDKRRNTCFNRNPSVVAGSEEFVACKRTSQRGGKKALEVLGSLQDYIYQSVVSK